MADDVVTSRSYLSTQPLISSNIQITIIVASLVLHVFKAVEENALISSVKAQLKKLATCSFMTILFLEEHKTL